MNIREKVARAMEQSMKYEPYESEILATAAITAFLEAAAEQGWHMRPDEATVKMKMEGQDNVDWKDGPTGMMLVIGVEDIYRAMLAAAPEFEWDK